MGKGIILVSFLLAIGCRTNSTSGLLGQSEIESRALVSKVVDEIAIELLKAEARFDPEVASTNGMEEFDREVVNLKADRKAFYQDWMQRLATKSQTKTDAVKYEINLIRRYLSTLYNFELLAEKYKQVSYFGYSDTGVDFIYYSLEPLLSIQNKGRRDQGAIERFNKYVNGDPGKKIQPLLVVQQEILEDEMKRFGRQAMFPYANAVKTHLETADSYLKGIGDLLRKTGKDGWQGSYAKLERQQKSFLNFIRTKILPNARKTPQLPRDMYLNHLQFVGVNAIPEQLINDSKADFAIYSKKLKDLADEIKKKNNLPAFFGIKDVSQFVRRSGKEFTPEEVLEFTYQIADEVTAKFRENNLMTVPDIRPKIRLATQAEYDAFPVPYVNVSPVLSSQRILPEYVLPLPEGVNCRDDDICAKGHAYTLTAHEIMPGHVFQYTLNLDAPSPLSRKYFSDNSANAEGWAVYVEDLLLNYVPESEVEIRFGIYASLAHRTARAFLDPMLQLGQIDRDGIMKVLIEEVGLTKSFSESEYERYSWNDVGQATSYYYGMKVIKKTKALARKQWGDDFSEKRFNDSFLRLGIAPLQDLNDLLFGRMRPQ